MENTRRLASGANGLSMTLLAEPVLVVDEQHAGDGGDEARERERRRASCAAALMPKASAARGFSRSAISTRPVRLRRIP